MKEKLYVFVYGTLMKGNSNQSYLSEQKFIGNAMLQGYSIYQVRSYPGIVTDKNGCVPGELYEIDEHTLNKLDKLESDGYLYKRILEQVCIDSTKYEAYVYVWLGSIENNHLKISFKNLPWRPYKGRCI